MEIKIEKPMGSYDNLTGDWENCYLKSKGISKFSLFEKDGKPYIEFTGNTEGHIPGSWKSDDLSPYAYKPTGERIDGFSGTFSTSAFDAQFIMYDNKGLVIVAAVIHFKENDQLNNWLVREFFFRKKKI